MTGKFFYSCLKTAFFSFELEKRLAQDHGRVMSLVVYWSRWKPKPIGNTKKPACQIYCFTLVVDSKL